MCTRLRSGQPVAIPGPDPVYRLPMARNSRKSRKRDKPTKPDFESKKQAQRAKEKGRLSWILLILAVVFFVCMRFAPGLESPWREILTVVQFLCPVVALVFLVRTYPHPIRMMNRKLNRERQEIERTKKKKRKKF